MATPKNPEKKKCGANSATKIKAAKKAGHVDAAGNYTVDVKCSKDAVPGFDVCDRHGGKTPTGKDSPHFAGAGRMNLAHTDLDLSFLPKRFRASVERNVRSGAAMSLQLPFWTLMAYWEENVKNADAMSASEMLKRASECFERADECYDKSDFTGYRQAIDQARELHLRAATDLERTAVVAQGADLLRRMADSETKRIAVAREAIPVDQFSQAMVWIGEQIREKITNPHEREQLICAIQSKSESLSRGGRAILDAGDDGEAE